MKKIMLLGFISIIGFIVFTCASLGGGTSVIQVEISAEQCQKQIQVRALDFERALLQVVNYGAFEWGRFNKEDADVFTKSIIKSMEKNSLFQKVSLTAINSTNSESDCFILDTVLLNQALIFTNQYGWEIAEIAYYLTDSKGKILFKDKISTVYFAFAIPLGMVKDNVNQAILISMLTNLMNFINNTKNPAIIADKNVILFNSIEEAIIEFDNQKQNPKFNFLDKKARSNYYGDIIPYIDENLDRNGMKNVSNNYAFGSEL